MPINKQQLDKLEKLLEVATESLTREEFVNAFERVVEFVKKIEVQNNKTIDQLTKNINETNENLKSKLEKLNITELTNAKQTIQKAMDKALKEQENSLNFIRDKVRKIKEGQDGKTPIKGVDYFDGKDADEDKIIKEILTKIEVPKIDTTIIDELKEKWEEELKTLNERVNNIPKRVMTPRFAYVPMVDDFSDNTDGSTKTFILSKEPRSLNTIKVWGSDFPHILRYNIDFTVSRKTLTLTSAVDAPTSGATLICEYYV